MALNQSLAQRYALRSSGPLKERVYVAMLARGYTGTTPRLRALAFGRADVLFLAALGAVLLPLRVVA